MNIFESLTTRCLELYTLEEFLEYNDVTHEEVVEFLLREGFIKAPDFLIIECEELDE
jgi:hypothetical protein